MSTSFAVAPATSQNSAEVARARVAVMVSRYQVDVVLPTRFTIETFIDDLLAVLTNAIDDDSVDFTPPSGQWSLARVGEPPIPRWRTLADHDVADGTVLMLSAVESPEVFTPLVEDITDALARTNARHFAEFDRDTATVAGLSVLGVGASAFAVMLGLSWIRSGSTLPYALPAVLLGASYGAAALVADRRAAAARTVLGLAIAALPLLFMGGAMLVPHAYAEPGPFTAANVAAGAAVVAIAAAALLRSTRIGVTPLLATAVSGVLIAAAALSVTYLAVSARHAVAATVFAGLLLLTAAPRLAVIAARIRPPDLPDPGSDIAPATLTDIFDESENGDEEAEGQTDGAGRWQSRLGADIERRARLAVTGLRGLILAASALLAGSTVIVAVTAVGGVREIVLAVAVSGLLVLRARWHPDRVQALALIAASTAIVVGAGFGLIDAYYSVSARVVVGAAVAGVAGVGCVVALRLPGRRLSPITRRLIDLAEYTLILVVPVLTFWIMGVYTAARGI
ncbi:type VII secretion integral membrane protein EccD [Nocardia sp. CDC160]|uniref:type VII secretion integral membrane protein EccD n=1 Tax=Nocardia sp. CDC160 TaxID=3112166 RepID=UPI002DBB4E8F|nr:type VII secretion integral membrane protein EccD [Nocardia sp. CDC160]MEC3920219.1 type VII secretion integral membrane protein EccD [Nocardia sp. CDC160]